MVDAEAVLAAIELALTFPYEHVDREGDESAERYQARAVFEVLDNNGFLRRN